MKSIFLSFVGRMAKAKSIKDIEHLEKSLKRLSGELTSAQEFRLTIALTDLKTKFKESI